MVGSSAPRPGVPGFRILALLVTSCVTSGKILNHSVPQRPQLPTGDATSVLLTELLLQLIQVKTWKQSLEWGKSTYKHQKKKKEGKR